MLGTMEQRTEGMKRQANELIEQAYNRGYKAGYDKAFATLNENWQLVTSEAEEKGRNEAWEVSKKILTMGSKKQNEIFGDYMDLNVIESVSASEAIQKIHEYEEKKKQEEDDKIKVGDEVYLIDSNHPRVVTCIFCENGDYEKAVQITESGRWVVDKISELHKTGRHFDAIEEVLNQMQEDG